MMPLPGLARSPTPAQPALEPGEGNGAGEAEGERQR